MNSKLTKFAKVAALGLALTFTLSCSSGSDDNGGGTSSQSGGGDLSSSSAGDSGGGGSSSSATSGGGSSSSVGGGTQGSCPNAVIGNNTISCGGQTYKTVLIGGKVWMAENLNYNAPNSECYDDDPANCVTYGKLYEWATAMDIDEKYNRELWSGSNVKHQGLCPVGWHIPNDDEWETLRDGTNIDDFAAQMGGNRKGAVFEEIGNRGYYWSATEAEPVRAWRWIMRETAISNHTMGEKFNGYSVRCVKD
jgi:hypothetical protein